MTSATRPAGPTTAPAAAPSTARAVRAPAGPRPAGPTGSRPGGPAGRAVPSGAAPKAIPPVGSAGIEALPWPERRGTRRISRRALIAIGLVVLLALGITAAALVASSGGSDPANGEASRTARLLGAADLPDGWTRVPPVTAITDPRTMCLIGAATAGTAPAVEPDVDAVGYRAPAGLPAMVEQIERYPSEAEAEARFSQLIGAALHGCPDPEGKTTGTLGASPATILTEPTRGDQSAMLTVPAGDGSKEIVFLGREGRDVVLMQLQYQGTIQRSLTDGIIDQAMGKLQ